MKSQNLAIEFATKAQAYYPSQAYNTPAIMEFASLIHATDEKLLDIGCGDGQLLRVLSERFPNLTLSGLTASEEERAACGSTYDVRVGDMHQLPWDDTSFDIVTARHSLEHSISPLIALFEINRVLKLGGKAYIVVPAPSSEWVLKWPDHFSVLPKPMWEKLFFDAGFEIEDFCEGSWIASYSMASEPEYRFTLRKTRDLGSQRVLDDRPEDKFEPTPSVNGTVLSPISDKRIVAVLHNLVLFDTIRPLLERFRPEVKIIVPESEIEGFYEMAKYTATEIAKYGFDVELSRLPAEIRCEIELSPYPYASPNVREARWRVRFMYGLAKEAWNFSVQNNVYYDFVIAYGEYDASILSALVPAYPVGNMKIRPVVPHGRTERPTLLYLPTYGPTSSIERAYEALMELKVRFKIVSKAHHGTSFLEPDRVALLRKLSDEYYDHATPLADLLETADVVLSDGSGAIFDAIAAGVPVAVFQPKVFVGLGGTESLEERLCKEGIIPCTNDPTELEKVIDFALDKGAQAQNELRSTLFISLGTEAVIRAENFLIGLLSRDRRIPPGYLAARKELRKWLEQADAETRARVVAEEQLHQTYQRLMAQLLEDTKRGAAGIVERDGQIASLNKAVAERDAQIAFLQKEQMQDMWAKERMIQQIKEELSRMEERLRWKRYRMADLIVKPYWWFCHPRKIGSAIRASVRRIARRCLPAGVRSWAKRKFFWESLPTFTNDNLLSSLKEFLAPRLRMSRHLVLIFSGCPFTESEGQRPLRLAREFAKREIPVIFAYWRWSPTEPPGKTSVWPGIFQIPIDTLATQAEEIFRIGESEDCLKIFLMEFPHPLLFELVNLANIYRWVTIYDAIDDWEEFHKVGQAPWYDSDMERYIACNADLVTATCEALASKLGDLGTNVLLVPNAFELGSFASPPPRSLEQKQGRFIIGYFGHLTAAWFDWELVADTASRHPDWLFQLIGYGEPPDLKLPPNIILLGKITHQLLPEYTRGWKVAIIPFKPTKLAQAVDPIKVYEYLALRLPVVATGIPHIGCYPYVWVADSDGEFDRLIEKAALTVVDEGQVELFLAQNTWKVRVDSLLDAAVRHGQISLLKQAVSA